MWQTIFTASVVISLIRVFPAFFAGVGRIKNSPRLTKFLDYTICLVTGEVIYSIAFNGIPKGDGFAFHSGLTAVTLLLAAGLMWYTEKLSRSLLFSVGFFVVGYGLVHF